MNADEEDKQVRERLRRAQIYCGVKLTPDQSAMLVAGYYLDILEGRSMAQENALQDEFEFPDQAPNKE